MLTRSLNSLKGATSDMPVHGLSDKDEATDTPSSAPTVAAVIVTRNRFPMLRETLSSIRKSTYKISTIVVSDDSSNDETMTILSVEFPDVLWVEGPRRGIAANRNRGISAVACDYILVSDDDICIAPDFVALGLEEIARSGSGLVFAPMKDKGQFIFPNNFDFLGFSSKPYAPGSTYNTANQQCFLIAREVTFTVPYDEVIDIYGYEEMDFAYRVAASGVGIACVSGCYNVHLDPYVGPMRHEKDAARLYVTFKRLAYVDKDFFRSALFLMVALPHHLAGSIRRFGLKGIWLAFGHFVLAAKMLFRFRRQGGRTSNRLSNFYTASDVPPR